jgi:serine palmitoyltransferase
LLHRRPALPCRPLKLTGSSQRCLNLGSYNYLGFAAQDEYCTPRVEGVLDGVGWAAAASRSDGGTTPRHAELERLVAEFLVGGPHAALRSGACSCGHQGVGLKGSACP